MDESGVELPRFYDVVTASFSLFSAQSLSDEEAVRVYLDMSVTMPPWRGPGRLGQHQADVAYQDRLEALGGIRVPTMVIGFECDMLTPPFLGQEVAKAIPGCRYVEIPGAAHAGPFEKPDEVNAALIDFFAGA